MAGAIGEINTEKRQILIEAMAGGMTIRAAAALARLSPATVYNWLTFGRQGREPYAQFLADFEAAEAESLREALANVKEAGRTDWKASAWYAERRHGYSIPKESWREREDREDAKTSADPSAVLTPDEQLAAAKSLPPDVLRRALLEAEGGTDADSDR